MIMTILGIISLVCFLMLVVKYPLRKLGLHKANAFMMKLHEAASLGLFLSALVQLVLGVKKYRKTRPFSVITGILAYLLDFTIITACHVTKDPVKKMRDHRILSLSATITTAVHVILTIFGL